MKVIILNIYILFFCFLSTITIDVSMIEEIHKVITKAIVNQTIPITLGIYDIYDYSTSEKNSISSF